LSFGKTIRLKRLIEPQYGSCIICALDHGMTSPTFLSGLYDTRARAREAIAGGANVFMLGRGMARHVAEVFTPTTSLALMLTASAAGRPQGAVVTPIGSVEEALRLGADAVVVYVALAGENEPEMIRYASAIGEACEAQGMPFIAEAEFPNAYQTLNEAGASYGAEYLLRNARLCAELGADIVKVNWSGDPQSFERIVRAAGVPVVVAGGTLVSDEELLTRMELAVSVGAIGCSVGRNIFQHRNPEAITRALCRVIREKWRASEALEELLEVSSVTHHVQEE
jgi:DhnA family fructose-bisphosphate aldolase class Ia